MSRGSEKWLLVQWNDGEVAVVHVRSLVKTHHEDLQPGSPLTAYAKGEPKGGKFICKSDDRMLLEQMQVKMQAETEGAPSAEPPAEPRDFSPSASSWEPSDDQGSESDEEEKTVKLDLSRKQYTDDKPKKRILTPSHRANAIIPEAMQRGKHTPQTSNKKPNRKRTFQSTIQANRENSLPDSTRTNSQVLLNSVTIDLNTIIEMKESFKKLFQIVKDMKTVGLKPQKLPPATPMKPVPNKTVTEMPAVSDDEKENDRSHSVESDRSEDNILISNKYHQYKGNTSKRDSNNVSKISPVKKAVTPTEEWIPIGSGQTLLHKDKFRKVNFKSYTIATRTLLLALFPRRILATHSLTGKRSPAFQNKPAKMCLDPKIISDVIIEIEDRFGVKENLIRSIITTKCADECKMYKMRQEKRRTAAVVENQDNEDTVEEDRNNRTACSN